MGLFSRHKSASVSFPSPYQPSVPHNTVPAFLRVWTVTYDGPEGTVECTSTASQSATIHGNTRNEMLGEASRRCPAGLRATWMGRADDLMPMWQETTGFFPAASERHAYSTGWGSVEFRTLSIRQWFAIGSATRVVYRKVDERMARNELSGKLMEFDSYEGVHPSDVGDV